MSLWQAITDWMHRPFKEPQDLGNWVLLVVLSATLAYGWNLVLGRVLEE